MAGLLSANQPEIVRAHQKDSQYIFEIIESFRTILSSLYGEGASVRWSRELNAASHLLYFLTTTGKCLQTLGEEYVNAIQVTADGTRVPSKHHRLGIALLQSLFPYLLDLGMGKLEKWILTADKETMTERQQELALAGCEGVRILSDAAQALHVAYFYMTSEYFHLGKRLLGVRYVKTRPGSGHLSQWLYRVIGLATLARLVTRYWGLGAGLQQRVRRQMKDTELHRRKDLLGEATGAEGAKDVRKCPLCLESRSESTAATCGHLFCWSCIRDWCETQPQCPLCRQDCQPNQLVYLVNYT